MEDLITQIAKATGVSESVARKAVGIVLKFLNRDGPHGSTQRLLAALPGADTLVSEQGEAGASALFGGFSDMMGGGMGAMAALGELTNAGLDMGQVQVVTSKLIAFARDRAGDALVDEVIDGIPGLRQFV